MANPIIVDPAPWDAATITGASCVGSMSLSNALRPQPSDKVRFTSTDSTYLILDNGGSGIGFDTVWIGYHNAYNTNCEMRVRTSNVSAAECVSNPDHDSGWYPMPQDYDDIDRRMHTIYHIATPVTSARYVRIDFFVYDAEGGYFEFGRLVVGEAWKPSWGVSFGGRFAVEESSTRLESQGGQIYTRVALKRKTFNGMFQFVTEDEAWETREKLSYARGFGAPVLFCLDAIEGVTNPPESTVLSSKTIYGVMSDPLSMNLVGYSYYETSFSITETP